MKKFFLLLFLLVITLGGKAASHVPVIFIPGFAASMPVEREIAEFLFNRGFPPERLKLSLGYTTLVRTLKNAGYREGKTFFGAVYDWRMELAPFDGNFDGILEGVTAELITSGNFSFAVNYLGFWLDQAVRANPGLEFVDVVTHSTGGIIARAYIQSPAYGAEYIDRDGIKRRLPRIRFLILGAAPNEGTVHSWRPWHGDFQDVLSGFIPTTEAEGRLLAGAFLALLDGKRINGPDYSITKEDILEADKKGELIPNPILFFRLYVPMRRSLMATNNFLIPTGHSVPININADRALRSDLLLDLNAQSSPGINPWLALIGTPSGKGGAFAIYATGARKETSIWDFFIPGLVNSNPFVSTLTQIVQLGKNEGSFLPLLELLRLKPKRIPVYESPFHRIGDIAITQQLAGDGNAPFVSYLGTFAGDPRITLVQWGNGPPPKGLPAELVWTKETDFPVYHVVFFLNPDVCAFVVSILTEKPIPPEQIAEGPFKKWKRKFQKCCQLEK